jgi:hypothetical protein
LVIAEITRFDDSRHGYWKVARSRILEDERAVRRAFSRR